MLLKILIYVLRVLLGPGLVGETLGVPELGVLGLLLYGGVEILVSEVVLSLVEENVASVEVDEGVVRLFLDGLVEILLGELVLANMIVGESAVVIMEGVLLEGDGLGEFVESLVVVLLLEVGEAEVVVSAGLVVLEADRLLEVLDGVLEAAHPPQTHALVEVGLVLDVRVRDVLYRLLVVRDALVQLVQLRLHLSPVEVVKTVVLVFLHRRLVVPQRLLVLTQLIVALPCKVPMVTKDLWICCLVR